MAFDTALGTCAAAGPRPASPASACPARGRALPSSRRIWPSRPLSAPPSRRHRAVLAGERRDLGDIARSTSAASTPSAGASTPRPARRPARTNGDIRPDRAGDRPDRRRGARDVGAALARNPTPVIVPCHRVAGGERQRSRVLGARRDRDEAADARARGRAGLRPAGALRLSARAAGCYWSAFASAASIAAATSAAPATPRGSLPFGQYSSLWTCSSGKPRARSVSSADRIMSGLPQM